MSTEPLREYFNCLRLFAASSFEVVDESTGVDLGKVKELIKQGCLSAVDCSDWDGQEYQDVSITPHGAVVLAEWSALLESKSFRGVFMLALGRFMWLVVGMLFTLFGALLLKLVE